MRSLSLCLVCACSFEGLFFSADYPPFKPPLLVAFEVKRNSVLPAPFPAVNDSLSAAILLSL
jgi:hypothetical protein